MRMMMMILHPQSILLAAARCLTNKLLLDPPTKQQHPFLW